MELSATETARTATASTRSLTASKRPRREEVETHYGSTKHANFFFFTTTTLLVIVIIAAAAAATTLVRPRVRLLDLLRLPTPKECRPRRAGRPRAAARSRSILHQRTLKMLCRGRSQRSIAVIPDTLENSKPLTVNTRTRQYLAKFSFGTALDEVARSPASDKPAPATPQADVPQEARPHLDEPALRALYADLLAHPNDDVAPEAPCAVAPLPEDWKDVLAGLARRTALVTAPTDAVRLASCQASPPGLTGAAEDAAVHFGPAADRASPHPAPPIPTLHQAPSSPASRRL
ncbi:hypothetical protein DFH11DRAFT_106660 [Phellopilus nigrolimitatus]|nr:hypothetical protein DFH11DRAFT_106660 [Phellopilus nigrolimitatus]